MEVSIAKGEAKGRVEGVRATLRKPLQLKFGDVSAPVDAKIEGASTENLEASIARVLTSQSADDVVGG